MRPALSECSHSAAALPRSAASGDSDTAGRTGERPVLGGGSGQCGLLEIYAGLLSLVNTTRIRRDICQDKHNLNSLAYVNTVNSPVTTNPGQSYVLVFNSQ